MFIMINEKPSEALIKACDMRIDEEDMFVNYRIDLTKLNDAQLTQLREAYDINTERLEHKSRLTLTLSTEV